MNPHRVHVPATIHDDYHKNGDDAPSAEFRFFHTQAKRMIMLLKQLLLVTELI